MSLKHRAQQALRQPVAVTTALVLTVAMWSASAFASANPPVAEAPVARQAAGAGASLSQVRRQALPQQPGVRSGGGIVGTIGGGVGGTGLEDWPMFRQNVEHTGANRYLTRLHNADPTTLSVQGNWPFTTGGAVTSSPAIANGLVFFGSHDTFLYAVDYHGNVKWKVDTGGEVASSPAVKDGRVFFTSLDGKLYARDTTGRQLWDPVDHGFGRSSPVVYGDRVYVAAETEPGGVYAFDVETGRQEWVYQQEGSDAGTAHDYVSSPAVREPVNGKPGLLIVADQEGYVTALYLDDRNMSGGSRVAWRTAVSSEAIDSSPALAANTVYVGSSDHNLYFLDADDGRVTERRTTKGAITSSPAIDTVQKDHDIYVTSSDGYLHRFSATDKAAHQMVPLGTSGDTGLMSSPALAHNVLYVGSGNTLEVFDANTMASLKRYPLSGYATSSPSLADGQVIVGTEDGHVYDYSVPGPQGAAPADPPAAQQAPTVPMPQAPTVPTPQAPTVPDPTVDTPPAAGPMSPPSAPAVPHQLSRSVTLNRATGQLGATAHGCDQPQSP